MILVTFILLLFLTVSILQFILLADIFLLVLDFSFNLVLLLNFYLVITVVAVTLPALVHILVVIINWVWYNGGLAVLAVAAAFKFFFFVVLLFAVTAVIVLVFHTCQIELQIRAWHAVSNVAEISLLFSQTAFFILAWMIQGRLVFIIGVVLRLFLVRCVWLVVVHDNVVVVCIIDVIVTVHAIAHAVAFQVCGIVEVIPQGSSSAMLHVVLACNFSIVQFFFLIFNLDHASFLISRCANNIHSFFIPQFFFLDKFIIQFISIYHMISD